MYPWRGLLTLLWLALAGCSTLAPTAPAVPVAYRPAPAISPVVTVHRSPQKLEEARADLWSVVRTGLELVDAEHPRIDAALRWFRDHPKLIAAIEPGADLYYAYMVDEVERRGLPMEIALLPIVESTLNPYALSRSGAAGIWQLMPDTAERYGVSIDWWYDGRRDPIDSTRAALDYLEYLHDYFDGDWLLAIAAYNCGEGCIARAQRRARSTSYWSLDLNRETEQYVPRILALARLIEDPDHYGVALPTLDLEPAFTLASITGQVDLGEIARMTSLGHDELFRLNPGLNRRATPPDGPHRLLVPADMAPLFDDLMESYPETSERWVQYVVKNGDSLSGIARRHHASVDDIRSHNAIRGSLIRVGQKLLIPVSASGRLSDNPLVAGFARGQRRGGTYTVAAGDSLWTISRRFQTSVASLLQTNGLDAQTPIRVGQKLTIPGGAKAPTARTIEYRVRRGDSLWQIANRFNVTVAQIVEWNGLETKSPLRPGVRLTLEI
jgi:membrane-bound lytic murein transglycosylase D